MAVFHLKYRPAKIQDLDSEEVVKTLSKILESEEIPQSFLFAGPKGSGKTSAARILARAVNCEKKDGIEPCGECSNCEEIYNGSSLDIIEIDAASNRGIEDVRALKEKAYLAPSRLKKKVFIIDEVHMLTKDAFNALLKLIEEPPKHTIFVLCTTDPEKIPDTVLSRLVRINFKKGNKKELKKSLEKIIKGEKIEIDNETADLIISKSDGSFRNLQRTFNEIYLQLGKNIDVEKVIEFFASKSGSYNEDEFEKDLSAGNLKIILEKLELMADGGVDFQLFRQNLLGHFQKKILANLGVGETESSKLSVIELENFIGLLIKAAKQEKDVEIDQLPLELAVIEFLGDKRSVEVKQKIEIQKPEEKIKPEKIEEKKSKKKLVKQEPDKEEIPIVFNSSLKIEDIEKEWGNVLIAVKPFNHSVEAFLRAARPKSVKGNTLILEVFYPFHKDRLEEAKNRKIVEDGLSKVFGINFCFECELAKIKKEPLVINNGTPEEKINEVLVDDKKKDLYDVAKEIFG
jgi:DNA polymerase-3 subunit gamma/tau